MESEEGSGGVKAVDLRAFKEKLRAKLPLDSPVLSDLLQVQNFVSIIELKSLARRVLPSSSALRDLILSEPDYLPNDEVMIKLRMYSKLLYRELKKESGFGQFD